MKKIIIYHWSTLASCPYYHKEEFKYSKTKRNKIVAEILDAELHVMIKDTRESCIISVDFYSSPFRQR